MDEKEREGFIGIILILIVLIMISLGICVFYLIDDKSKSNEKSKGIISFTIPEESKFFRLCNEKYIEDINDCSNKAGKYARHLIWNGYDAKVIAVSNYRYKELHGIVKVKINNMNLYLDPTHCTYGFDLLNYWNFEFEVSTEQLYTNPSFN